MGDTVDLRKAQDDLLRAVAERDEAALEGRKAIMRRLELVERLHFPDTIARPDEWACVVSRDRHDARRYSHFVLPWPPGPLPSTDVEITAALRQFRTRAREQAGQTPQEKARAILAAGVLFITDRERGFLERIASWRGAVPEWQKKRLAHMWGCHLAELNKGARA
jgi:hypothetical protein